MLYTLAGMAVGLHQVTVNALYPRSPRPSRPRLPRAGALR